LTVTVWVRRSGVFALILPVAIAFGEHTAALPDGPGRQIVERACTTCHGIGVVTSKKLSKQRWQVLVLAMTGTESRLSDTERAEAVEYLTKNFGVSDRGRELVEDICSLCHEVDRIKEQHLSKEEWAGVIKGMIFEGAPVTDEEFNMIVEYLAKNFGRRTLEVKEQ
jgi:cytochrome c5